MVLTRLVLEREFKVAEILSISIRVLGEIISNLFLVRAIMSWFVQPGRNNGMYYFISSLTEPFIAPVRNIIMRLSKGNMMFDFSLLIAWILVDSFIVPALITFVNYIFI